MITVREYQPSDLAFMPELMSDLGSPSTLEEMKKRMALIDANPYYETFIAEIDGKVVGMVGARLTITYTNNQLKTQISSLVTKKEYEGQGIGRALIKRVEEWAKENGSTLIYLLSGNREERKRAHQFYQNIGFDITGYRFVKKLSE